MDDDDDDARTYHYLSSCCGQVLCDLKLFRVSIAWENCFVSILREHYVVLNRKKTIDNSRRPLMRFLKCLKSFCYHSLIQVTVFCGKNVLIEVSHVFWNK